MKNKITLFFVLFFSGLLFAQQNKTVEYYNWKQLINKVTILEEFDISNRQKVVLLPIDTLVVQMPEKMKNTMAQRVLLQVAKYTFAENFGQKIQKGGYKFIKENKESYLQKDAIVLKIDSIGIRQIKVLAHGKENRTRKKAELFIQGRVLNGNYSVANFSHGKMVSFQENKHQFRLQRKMKNIVTDLVSMTILLGYQKQTF